MIYGLEDNNYCVHTPIPVEVTTASPSDWLELQLINSSVPLLDQPPRLYKGLDDRYKIDLSRWIRQFMPSMVETISYTSTPSGWNNSYEKDFEVVFTDSNTQVQTAIRIFVHCSLYSGKLEDNTDPIKMWKCYPFSFAFTDGVVFFVNTLNTPADTPDDVDVEYDTSCCGGTYLRWLNEYGHHNYWLFRNTRTIETSGEEYFRIPRNIFNPDKTSNEDTAGFDMSKTMSLKAIVDRKYFHLFESLVGSPEVYMLRPDYVLGSNVAPSDWIKIIQDDVTFERDELKGSAEIEFDFSLPKPYTQTRL